MEYVLMMTRDVCFTTCIEPILPQAVIYIFAIEASRQPESFSATADSEKNREAHTPEAFASQLIGCLC